MALKVANHGSRGTKLILFGFILFLLGLIVGFIIPVLPNPRMGLSSHLEGVMNGMFLVMLGLIWDKIWISSRWLTATYWAALYGTFVNWAGILIAASFNAGAMLNVAAEGRQGPPMAEGIVTFSLVSLSLAMIFVCSVVITGLSRYLKQE